MGRVYANIQKSSKKWLRLSLLQPEIDGLEEIMKHLAKLLGKLITKRMENTIIWKNVFFNKVSSGSFSGML